MSRLPSLCGHAQHAHGPNRRSHKKSRPALHRSPTRRGIQSQAVTSGFSFVSSCFVDSSPRRCCVRDSVRGPEGQSRGFQALFPGRSVPRSRACGGRGGQIQCRPQRRHDPVASGFAGGPSWVRARQASSMSRGATPGNWMSAILSAATDLRKVPSASLPLPRCAQCSAARRRSRTSHVCTVVSSRTSRPRPQFSNFRAPTGWPRRTSGRRPTGEVAQRPSGDTSRDLGLAIPRPGRFCLSPLNQGWPAFRPPFAIASSRAYCQPLPSVNQINLATSSPSNSHTSPWQS